MICSHCYLHCLTLWSCVHQGSGLFGVNMGGLGTKSSQYNNFTSVSDAKIPQSWFYIILKENNRIEKKRSRWFKRQRVTSGGAVCGRERRELVLTPEGNKGNAGLFCPVHSTLSYKQDGRWKQRGEDGGGGERWWRRRSSRLLTPGGQRESISSLNYCRPRDAAG